MAAALTVDALNREIASLRHRRESLGHFRNYIDTANDFAHVFCAPAIPESWYRDNENESETIRLRLLDDIEQYRRIATVRRYDGLYRQLQSQDPLRAHLLVAQMRANNPVPPAYR